MDEADVKDGAWVVGLWCAAATVGLVILEVLRAFSAAAQKTSGNSAVQLVATAAMVAAVVGFALIIDQFLNPDSRFRRWHRFR